jgi:hypothetical protein
MLTTVSCWILHNMTTVLDKFVEKIKTHFLCSITLFRQSCPLWDNVEKFGAVREATDDSTIGLMRFTCWTNKATDRRWEYVILSEWVSTATIVSRTRLTIMLYAHCPYCYKSQEIALYFPGLFSIFGLFLENVNKFNIWYNNDLNHKCWYVLGKTI